MRHPQLATRLFGVPLLIEQQKLEIILAAIAPRLGLAVEQESTNAYGPGDNGKSRKDYYVTSEGIAVIDVVGPLVKRASGDFLSGGPTTYGQIESEFMDASTDPAIRGILLQIDSPGGESTGAFELADLIHSQRGSKPIFASADGDAFSAAYAIAAASDRLYVTRSGGVGSVGVWMMHVDQSAYNEKEGFSPTLIFAGARKVDGNPHAPLSKEAKGVFQAEVDRIYQMFVASVARDRGMSEATVKATEAGLFFGESAVEAGLADKIGTFGDALAAITAQASINSTSSAGMSAANSNRRNSMKTEQADAPAPAADPKETVDQAPKEPEKPSEDAVAAATTAGFRQCAAVVEMCALAGLSATASLRFLRADASSDDLRKEILEARAEAGGEQINSHIMPDAGAPSGKASDSPLVKAAEQLAANNRKEK